MININKSLGESVRKRRKTLGISQEELADRIGRDPRSIVAIETGNRNPTLKTLYKLCRALGIKSSDILPF